MLALFKIILALFLIGDNSQQTIIGEYLKTQLNEYEKIEHTVIAPKNIEQYSIMIDDSRDFKLNGNYGYVPVKEKNNDGSFRNSLVTVKLKLFKKVMVANRQLRKKENLSNSDFTIKYKEVSTLRFQPISENESLEYYRCKFNVSENTILQNSMIEKIPDIEVGDRIEAFYTNNSVAISFDATSRSEGSVGNIIKIKSDDQRIFKAEVLNNSTVKIIE
ncbi:MAG: flagellar basal body P-ring formation chaperone FlgA [Melioribacteraceae bacterium]|nr:flagellar basal body P-ring formation chaperone FlgA [Melioribacteraceae bacterium]